MSGMYWLSSVTCGGVSVATHQLGALGMRATWDGAAAHPLLAIAILQVLEMVVLPLWPKPHTQQREPALLGHGREIVSEASK